MSSWSAFWADGPDGLRDAHPRSILADLRAALADRWAMVGVALATPAEPVADKKPASFITPFQASMTNLLAVAINHTVNGGDLNGLATYPGWTQADMLAAIGDAARHTGGAGLSLRAWAWQQYRMLNLLRWLRVPFATYESNLGSYKEASSGVKGTWAEAVAALEAAWAAVSYTAEALTQSYSVGRVWGKQENAGQYSAYLRTDRGRPAITLTAAPPRQYAIFYLGQMQPHPLAGEFNGGVAGYQEDYWYSFGRDDVERSFSAGVNYLPNQVEPQGFVSPYTPEPGEWETYAYSHRCWIQSFEDPRPAYLVMQGDGPNGLEYRDWE